MNALPAFHDAHLPEALHAMDDAALDTLPFGVIGFNQDARVVRYNRTEADAASFERDAVLGQHVFVELAPCLNNYLVAGRFDDSLIASTVLDEIIPYVLTFRMRPTPVRLRLLSEPGAATRYILVERSRSSK